MKILVLWLFAPAFFAFLLIVIGKVDFEIGSAEPFIPVAIIYGAVGLVIAGINNCLETPSTPQPAQEK